MTALLVNRWSAALGLGLTQVLGSQELQVRALPIAVDSRNAELVVSLFRQVAHCEFGDGDGRLVTPHPGEAHQFLAFYDIAVNGDGAVCLGWGPS